MVPSASVTIISKRFFIVSLIMSQFVLGVYLVPSAFAEENLAHELEEGERSVTFSGTEKGGFTIKKNVKVKGKGNAVINGDIVMRDGSFLSNVTINATNRGITVAKNASVHLKNVTIKGANDAGIWTEGKGKLKIENSTITRNRKGVYVQSGKNVELKGNEIKNNREEGLDIRANVRGSISNNTLSNNGEGGAEIVVNKSSLSIRNNKFSGNGSSGIALQFYKGSKATGDIDIKNNTFSSNKAFGVACNAPSGGNVPTGFFSKSISFEGNSFGNSKNKSGDISQRCKLANGGVLKK